MPKLEVKDACLSPGRYLDYGCGEECPFDKECQWDRKGKEYKGKVRRKEIVEEEIDLRAMFEKEEKEKEAKKKGKKEMSRNKKYAEGEKAYIVTEKNKGTDAATIVKTLTEKFGSTRTESSVNSIYRDYRKAEAGKELKKDNNEQIKEDSSKTE